MLGAGCVDSVEWLGSGSNCSFAKSHILKRFCGALLFTSSTCQKSDFIVWECAIRESQPADIHFSFSLATFWATWRDKNVQERNRNWILRSCGLEHFWSLSNLVNKLFWRIKSGSLPSQLHANKTNRHDLWIQNINHLSCVFIQLSLTGFPRLYCTKQ